MRRTLKLTGMMAALLLLMAAAVPAGATTVTERIEKSFPLKAGAAFSIENVNGDITVESWDKEELSIVAVKTVKGTSEDRAKKDLAALKVLFRTEGSKVIVETDYPQGSFWDFNWLGGGTSKEVVFTVMAPKGVKMTLTSVNGDLTVGAPGSEVQAETVNGAVNVSGAKLLEATTVNGRVTFDVESVRTVETTNGSVDGTVRAVRPDAGSVETVNGSVHLRVASGAALRLDLENVNGSIDSAFPGLEGGKHTRGGELNGGGNALSVETVNGSIQISKL